MDFSSAHLFAGGGTPHIMIGMLIRRESNSGVRYLALMFVSDS